MFNKHRKRILKCAVFKILLTKPNQGKLSRAVKLSMVITQNFQEQNHNYYKPPFW
jgi:hypothetical protein